MNVIRPLGGPQGRCPFDSTDPESVEIPGRAVRHPGRIGGVAMSDEKAPDHASGWSGAPHWSRRLEAAVVFGLA
jgi:hypothetical protein